MVPDKAFSQAAQDSYRITILQNIIHENSIDQIEAKSKINNSRTSLNVSHVAIKTKLAAGGCRLPASQALLFASSLCVCCQRLNQSRTVSAPRSCTFFYVHDGLVGDSKPTKALRSTAGEMDLHCRNVAAKASVVATCWRTTRSPWRTPSC